MDYFSVGVYVFIALMVCWAIKATQKSKSGGKFD